LTKAKIHLQKFYKIIPFLGGVAEGDWGYELEKI